MVIFKTACISAGFLITYTVLYITVRAIPDIRAGKATGPSVLLSQIVSPWYWGGSLQWAFLPFGTRAAAEGRDVLAVTC